MCTYYKTWHHVWNVYNSQEQQVDWVSEKDITNYKPKLLVWKYHIKELWAKYMVPSVSQHRPVPTQIHVQFNFHKKPLNLEITVNPLSDSTIQAKFRKSALYNGYLLYNILQNTLNLTYMGSTITQLTISFFYTVC